MVVLTGCRNTSPEEVIGNIFLWIIFLIVMAVLAIIGLVVAAMVLLAPPFVGLVSGLLLRRDASPRRRWFVVAVGLLNLSNLALFIWLFFAMLQEAIQPVVGLPPEVSPYSNEDAILFLLAFGALLVINLAVGVYSLVVGLRIPGRAL